MKYKTFLVSFVAIACLVPIVFLYSHVEAYCFFWPSIDTKYAPSYSEPSFERVEVGMTQDQVVELLGHPLTIGGTHGFDWRHSANKVPVDEVWDYTSDGATPWGDWAWFSRKVIFRGDRVVQRVKWTYYD